MKNKKKTIGLTLTALTLVLCLAAGSAMAYFTTYVTAKGSKTITLGATETIPNETVSNEKKEITVQNTGKYDCYVRIKALTGDAYESSIIYSEPDNAEKWTLGADGYYYYSEIVPAETGETSQIDVAFTFPSGEELPDFNIIIIQESTPVLYDANGTPYADWDAKADVINPAPAPQPQE